MKKAVSQTLYLILSPYDFFSDTLERQGTNQVRTDELKGDIKYLKINRPPLERLVQRLEEKRLDHIAGNEAFALLDQILEEVNFTPEDVDAYLRQFSEVVHLDVDQLYDRKAISTPIPAAPQMVKAAPPMAPKQNTVTGTKTNVAESLGKIGKIKQALTINQKFMFTKILFNGDFEIFSSAIDKLDRFDNLVQAMKYLDQNYPEWDKESEEYEEFIELIEKRFS